MLSIWTGFFALLLTTVIATNNVSCALYPARRYLDSHTAGVYSISAVGDTIVTCSQDDSIKIWEAGSNSQTELATINIEDVNSVALKFDDPTILAAAVGSNIMVWNIANPDNILELYTLTGHSDTVRHLCFSPDSTILASSANDFTTKLWDIDTSSVLHTFSGLFIFFTFQCILFCLVSFFFHIYSLSMCNENT